MEILLVVDKILQNVVVRWLLLTAAVTALIAAAWANIQLGTVRLQRDAAQGQSATYRTHLDLQNEAIRQAGEEAATHNKKMAAATRKAEEMKRAAEHWKLEAGKVVLTGNCDQMVDQVIAALQWSKDDK